MGETIKRCKNCGKLFNSYGGNFCVDCVEELDEIFEKVQDYVFDHENASVVEISQALEIDGKIILSFIKDGSLVLGEGVYAFKCSRCGEPISEGEYCDSCKSKLSKLFAGATHSNHEPPKQEEKKKRARMHIRHN